ncbi:uncharacterized protein LOC124272857 [Haliotis rubra]|uniref:uncharacterized protein LOC124272857 n=1 Tax=Haliotis rubra TaxID=36100 RepID=UPI001EE5087F|nr:uncharacterized protein LOC124272857 [Haliotis rubra]
METDLEAELRHEASGDENTATGTQQREQVQRFIKQHRRKEETNATTGKLMEGKDEDTGMWFKVKIIQEGNSRVNVHWMNYSKHYDSWIETSLIRPIKPKFAEGDMVSARYNVTYRTMYPATVVAVDGDKVFLRYEVGLEKKIHQRYVEKRN